MSVTRMAPVADDDPRVDAVALMYARWEGHDWYGDPLLKHREADRAISRVLLAFADYPSADPLGDPESTSPNMERCSPAAPCRGANPLHMAVYGECFYVPATDPPVEGTRPYQPDAACRHCGQEVAS